MEMKKKFSMILILVLVVVFFCMLLSMRNKEEMKDENKLYSRSFGSTIIKFEKYDSVLGQNIVVGVEKSTNRGKDYKRVTEEVITVSQEARFLFIDELTGYVISTGYVTRTNNFRGFKVTLDGGKTFKDAEFYYTNDRVDLITIEDFPYQDGDMLKLECSIYDVKENGNGYEEKKIVFNSTDKGLTWYLEYTVD